jgi:hypothetical protein
MYNLFQTRAFVSEARPSRTAKSFFQKHPEVLNLSLRVSFGFFSLAKSPLPSK